MDNTPTNRRRWFRFSLRTLLLVVAAVAVASWAYWIGWPWWTVGREEARFVELSKQIHVGMTIHEASQLIPDFKYSTMWHFEAGETRGDIFQSTENYFWPDAIYCIHYLPKDSQTSPCVLIEVFRLAPMPHDYQQQLELSWKKSPEMSGIYGYVIDFATFIFGDRKNNPGFKYELIYSDPPAKPEPKPSN